jgi:tetratricopeptide (TPR) repeat protein
VGSQVSVATARTLPADFAQGLEWLDRAIAADRNNASAYLFRSTFWVNLGFFDRALADQDRCLAIDPAYQNCLRWKALTLLFAGDTDIGAGSLRAGRGERIRRQSSGQLRRPPARAREPPGSPAARAPEPSK